MCVYTKIKIIKPHTWTCAHIRICTRLFHTRVQVRVCSGDDIEPVGIWCVMMLCVGYLVTMLFLQCLPSPKTRTLALARCNDIAIGILHIFVERRLDLYTLRFLIYRIPIKTVLSSISTLSF